MAIAISKQPVADSLISTLVAIPFEMTETTLSTTNLVAECWWIDQTSAVETQIGGRYRLAPNLTNPDFFKFDGSEIFNTLTKYTLKDLPASVMGEKLSAFSDGLKSWKDIANFKVKVKFYREYIDPLTGLIVLDATPEVSNVFYIHEGFPETEFVPAIHNNIGSDVYYVSPANLEASVFHFFKLNYSSGFSGDRKKRFLTATPINNETYVIDMGVNESYIVNFFTPETSFCDPYQFNIKTYDSTDTLLQTRTTDIDEQNNMYTLFCGFRDMTQTLTPDTPTEGANWENVAYYFIHMSAGDTISAPCTRQQTSIDYKFVLNRKCDGKGYLRFVFKNYLGGWDFLSSRGEYRIQNKSAFNDFEESLGFTQWNNTMSFGQMNWANTNVKLYKVTTHPMTPKKAEHYIQMLNSVDVYLEKPNTSADQVESTYLTNDVENFPFVYYSIWIKKGNYEMVRTSKNLVRVKFSFGMSVNQITPRY